ncbi:MAG: hypothetical protein IKJ73_07295 [Lachnospiraceae bacterium]|nr:hypothetical protein [Lachnospiraceae bacterium]
MKNIDDILKCYKASKVAVYGLGTETERFLSQQGDKVNIVGLLDGFCEEGEMYGYPIISMQEAELRGVKLIVVVARPGSCKAIAKRIGDFCKENEIALFDVRGKNLLENSRVTFNFSHIEGESKEALWEKVKKADTVSFDLFDTLVMRKVLSYTDVFSLLERSLEDEGIRIPEFAKLRLGVEKNISKNGAPTLEKIYLEVLRQAGMDLKLAEKLALLEWKLDYSLLTARPDVCEVFRHIVGSGKRVYITSDTYYRRWQIEKILSKFEVTGAYELLLSCEEGTSKTNNLYDHLLAKTGNVKVLHIGDDETADIEMAASRGIDTFRLYNGATLFDALGELGVTPYVLSLSDRIRVGLFIARMFGNAFWFDEEQRKLCVSDAYDIGYLFCAPMISDFVFWLKNRVNEEGLNQILFCARDGYLVEKLYKNIDKTTNSVYFLTSRTAAIRAGMEQNEDIDYVNSMKYFGSVEENMRVRFGIDASDIKMEEYNNKIFEKAILQRENYNRYINGLGLEDGELAIFDFVAKGTTQLYLQRLFSQHMKGFYFLQLEPEFMKHKGLDISPFYSEEEKDNSVIFDSYYILETLLTSLQPSVSEFDENGNAIYAAETRTQQDLKCVERMQKGVLDYFDDYIGLISEDMRECNKKLDETFFALINKVFITDKDFLSLVVEDPFFGRMTDIKTMI